jgi:hypothetical protein
MYVCINIYIYIYIYTYILSGGQNTHTHTNSSSAPIDSDTFGWCSHTCPASPAPPSRPSLVSLWPDITGKSLPTPTSARPRRSRHSFEIPQRCSEGTKLCPLIRELGLQGLNVPLVLAKSRLCRFAHLSRRCSSRRSEVQRVATNLSMGNNHDVSIVKRRRRQVEKPHG